MALTDLAVKNLKPENRMKKYTDRDGLYVVVTPSGGKLWRFDYRFRGKRKTLSIGPYPEWSLTEAREELEKARKMLSRGLDPAEAKQHRKEIERGENGFELIAREWFSKFSREWAPGHADRVIRALERDVFPWIGNRAVHEITPPEYLKVLRRVEERGAVDTAHRLRQIGSAVFRYCIATGRAERDICADLRGAIPPVRGKNMAVITDHQEVGALLRAIDEYRGGLIVRCALRLAPLVFVRPGELRRMEWAEINFTTAEWVIPAEKMKMRQAHIVPLSSQALEILEEIKAVTGEGQYVFPSPRTWERPMSENAVLAALRSMGYAKEQMTGHGFRSMASTLLNAMGWEPDVIEKQLAHSEKNRVRAAYNRHDYLPERTKMMQAWANYLDALREGATVLPFRKAE
jgi:integrase